MWNPGIISKYQFYVSTDGVDWKMVDEGEFSSIKNNPLWQTKRFVPEQARFIRLRALKNMDGSNETGYAEIDVIAK
jgi:alpha-L-fucosidase